MYLTIINGGGDNLAYCLYFCIFKEMNIQVFRFM